MKLLYKLLCKLGLHDYYHVNVWEPSIKAKIVNKVTFKTYCGKCDFEKIDVNEFDPKTGMPIE